MASKRPAAALLKRPAARPAAPRTRQSKIAGECWDAHALYSLRVRRGSTVPVSGRCILQVTPNNIGNANMEGEHATVAICLARLRDHAQAGDVLWLFSSRTAQNRNRGVDGQGAVLLLRVMKIDGAMSPATYHSPAAPPWAQNRTDQIYKAISLYIIVSCFWI